MFKRIFLAYIYGSRNAGDMAINLGTLDLLNQIGNFEISALSRFSRVQCEFSKTKTYLEKRYNNLTITPYPISFDRHTQNIYGQLCAFVKGVGLYFPSLKHSINKFDNIFPDISQSSYVIFNGGNLLFSNGLLDDIRLLGLVYPLEIARVLDKPFGFLPQSIPGLNTRFGRRLVESLFNRARFIYFRESFSMSRLKIGDSYSTKKFLDTAFYIQGFDYSRANEILQRNNLVKYYFVPIVIRGSNLGDYTELSKLEVIRTVEFVIKICKDLIQEGLMPILVVQTKTDLNITKICQQRVENYGVKIPFIEEYDPLVLRTIYSLSKAVISFRLHAAILALSVGTPTIGIYRSIWGPKMPGIYSDLGIHKFCLNFDENYNAKEVTKLIYSLNNRTWHDVNKQISNEKEMLIKSLREHLNAI